MMRKYESSISITTNIYNKSEDSLKLVNIALVLRNVTLKG